MFDSGDTIAPDCFISCIEDMIFIERDNFADVAYRVWRLFATACGMLIPDDKSPPPYFAFRALGLLDT